TRDGRYRYAVRQQIVLLLPELALVAAGADSQRGPQAGLRAEKQRVRRFYDEVGWTIDDRGVFDDAARFEDRRSVSAEYIHRCHLRVARHLPPAGRYLLDAASGPVQYPEYLAYSRGFERRVCVDLSFAALQAARRNLGPRGIYILGDITNLPLRDGAVDAAVSLHTIYHVPADEQATAFRELSRVVRPGNPAVVVYAWKSPWIRLLKLPPRLARLPVRIASRLADWFARRLGADQAGKSPADSPLYFHAHSCGWFTRQAWPFEFEIHCWRSVSVDLLQSYFHRALAGRAALRALFQLEESMPGLLGRRGAYPLIVLRRNQAGKPEASNQPGAARRAA
ncbi:MAG: class I SAM-dependent methyltransferase, partial [Pirellulaceae bacterium]|nr:class I SAM-dependent methyltransferase [Pirellulaceae bacterium]